MLCNPSGKIGKATEDVPVSGHQLTPSILKMCERTETVDLQFIDEVVRIERFRTAGEPHGA